MGKAPVRPGPKAESELKGVGVVVSG
ncbi:MAG: hypothetical protein RLZ81_809, partial [Pseudomonadota bacterium]